MKKNKIFWISWMLFLPTALFAQEQNVHSYTFGEGMTFSSTNGYELNFRGYMQPYYEFKSYTDADIDEPLQRFRMRRLRLRLSGSAAKQKIEYRFQADFSGSSEAGDQTSQLLFDAWIAYNITDDLEITFGQKVTPTDNRELMMGSQTLQLPERSRVTSNFASIREFGVFIDGRFRTGRGTYLKPALAITNGDGGNVFTADYGGLKIGGRVDFLPFGLFTNYGQYRQGDIVRELAPKLVVGVNYSLNMGMSSRRGRGSGEILYLDEEGEVSLPDYTKYGFDFMFKYRGFSVLGEFVGSSATVPDDITTRVRNDGSTSNTFEVDGEQNVENYVKNRMMIGRGYNIQAGYIFKNLFSIDARYCHLDSDEFSFMNNGTFYNRPNYYTLGVTKYFSRSYGYKVQASMTYVEADPGSNDINSNPMEGNEWIGRLIVTLSF
ncbi:porin [Halocola ammonii]